MAVRGLIAWRNSSPRFDLDQLHARGAQLVVERVAVRFLDDHFRLQSGQVRQLLDECFIVAGQDSGQSGLNRGRRAGSHQRSVSLRQLEHLGDSFSRRYLQFGHADKVPAGLGHYGFQFRAKNGATQHRHRPLAVDHGRDPQLFVGIVPIGRSR